MIYEKMENDKLTEILIQIALLNEKIDTMLLNNNKISRRVDNLEDKHDKLVTDFSLHQFNCPMQQKIKQLEEDLSEYKMIKKYSKHIPVLFVISVIMSLLVAAKFFGIM